MEEINDMLEAEIKDEIDNLSLLEFGGKEHTAAVSSIEKLYNLRMESDKFQKCEDSKDREEAVKREQIKAEAISRNLKTAVEVLGLVVTTGVGIWVTVKGFKFEETGTFCSTTLRNSIPWFKPKK